MQGSIRFPTAVILATVLTLCSGAVSSASAQTAAYDPILVTTNGYSTQTTTGAAAAILARAKRQGKIRVIVGLDMTIQDEDALGPAQRSAQLKDLRSVQDSVIGRVAGDQGLGSVTKYDYIPYLALNLNARRLRRLLTDPGVLSVQEDIPVPPALKQANKIIEANEVWANGRTGRGWVVAVIDTGVDKKSPMLRKQVVSEACYSTGAKGGISGARSLCPNRVNKLTGPGSAKLCRLSISQCDHGTWVSAIAMGRAGRNKGVAHASKLIAIKAASRITRKDVCAPWKSPCARSFNSSLIKGLERVYALRKKYKIAAVTVSAAGGSYSEPCDSQFPAMTAIIKKLRKKKIATTIATGNLGLDGSIGQPACISAAVAVGATDSQLPIAGSEKVTDFSNHSSLVDVMAPGARESIRAGAPRPKKYDNVGGTSAASPFVTGAFALLRQAKPKASVDDILAALKCTGKDIVRDGLPKPRIALKDAFFYLRHGRPQRSWNFNTAESPRKWTQLLGEWGVRQFEVDNSSFQVTKLSSRPWSLAYHRNCDRSLRVTAKMKRLVPDGKENLDWKSGIFLKATFDRNDRNQNTVQGYWFAYSASPLPREDEPFGSVSIWQLDNYNLVTDSGSSTRLCFNFTKVNYQGWNLLAVESRPGSQTFFLNGQEVCSATSSAYTDGQVAVAMVSPIFGSRDRNDHDLEVDFLNADPIQ